MTYLISNGLICTNHSWWRCKRSIMTSTAESGWGGRSLPLIGEPQPTQTSKQSIYLSPHPQIRPNSASGTNCTPKPSQHCSRGLFASSSCSSWCPPRTCPHTPCSTVQFLAAWGCFQTCRPGGRRAGNEFSLFAVDLWWQSRRQVERPFSTR